MSKKITRAGGESTEVSDELYMAHHVHTLAQLLAQRLTGGWGTPRAYAGPVAENFVPPMGTSPWTPGWSAMGQPAPTSAPAPMYVAVPPQSLVYWYP